VNELTIIVALTNNAENYDWFKMRDLYIGKVPIDFAWYGYHDERLMFN
jgi:hypothetical protein